MQPKHLFRAGMLALTVTLLFISAWEGYWRIHGYVPTFNDGKELWANKRAEVNQPAKKATVFIGSSRIKFDLDIPTWREITGEDAVQLSLVGTSPILLLKDLADDTSFAGKLIVDVTEPLFFSKNPAFHKSAGEAIAFYKKETPAEKLSNQINFALESQLTFLEERRFSINTLLNDLEVPNRAGVFSFPAFPKTFEWTTEDRQTYMSDLFLNDPNSLKRQTDIWTALIMGDKTPPLSGHALEAVFLEVKESVAKIRERGGKVIFVRTPSSGMMGDGEAKFFPREVYWEPLLKTANAEGIHFRDYPVMRDLTCPEWSHLAPKDAVLYTKLLADALTQKAWF